MNSFTQKSLRVTFTLSNGSTFSEGGDVLVLEGLRMQAAVRGFGFPSFPEAELTIFGMSQSDMRALTSLAFNPLQIQRNTLQIDANPGNGYTTIFVGQILGSFIDYSGAPQVCLRMNARTFALQSLQSAPAVSYPGPTDVALMVSNIAAQSGYAFVNNGVTAQLSSPYCSGTVGDQLRAIGLSAGIDVYVDSNIIEICPKGQPRELPAMTLTPQTGLVGYPVADARGFVTVRALYNPQLRFGAPLTISGSDVVIANNTSGALNSRADGNWLIGVLGHVLDAVKPNGSWFSDMLLYPPGQLPPIQ